MRTSNIFTNPAGTAVPGSPDPATGGWTADRTAYHWKMNHGPEGEEESGPRRNIDYGAPTSGVGVVRQQGAETPTQLRYTGRILDPTQHRAMVLWDRLSRTQTIYFTDFAGDSYEVLITAFQSKRRGVVKNPQGGAEAPRHVWEYSIEMDVIRVLSGSWA